MKQEEMEVFMHKNRYFALVLSLVFALSLLPAAALAADGEDPVGNPELTALKETLAAAAEGTDKTVTLTADVTITDADLAGLSQNQAAITVPAGVTLDGGSQYSITATGWSDENQGKYHILSVENAADETAIQNLTIEGCANTKSGVHVYSSTNVALNNVTIQNCGQAAVIVNGSTVTATGLKTGGNAWGGVNVDKGQNVETPAAFTLVSGELQEPAKVWTDQDSDDITVTVPENWLSEKRESQTFYAPAPVRLTDSSGGTYYSSLSAAVAAVHEKEAPDRMAENVIDLLADYTGGGFGAGYESIQNYTTSGNSPVNIIFDLNGHKYTVTAPTTGSAGTETNGFQLLSGSKITIRNGAMESALGDILIQNYSDLILDSVAITATNASYVLSNNCGQVSLIGSTSITAGEGKFAFDVCVTTNYPAGVTVTVDTTGAITGKIEYGVWDGVPDPNNARLYIKNGAFTGAWEIDEALAGDAKDHLHITGGAFDAEAIKDYVSPGYRAVHSGGTWTVSRIPTPPSTSYTPPTTTTTTVTNPDGSTTTTTTNRNTGTVTETTKYPDGSTTAVETKKDGTVTTTEKTADGSVTTTVAKPDGSSQVTVAQADGTTASVTTAAGGPAQAQVTVSSAAVAAARESGDPVTLPIPALHPAEDPDMAPTVAVTLPKAGETVQVEIPADDVTPGVVAVLVHPDGSEEVILATLPTEAGVSLPLSGSATVRLVDNTKPFDDLPGAHWAKDSVDFVAARELFQGTAQKTFSPDVPMTRAMVLTVLARVDAVEPADETAWYGGALAWAVEKGISDGAQPQAEITREQLVTMLYRYSGSPKTSGGLSLFPDASQVSPFAADAMRWAVEVGVINGTGAGTLAPAAPATRAQAAAMLERFLRLR